MGQNATIGAPPSTASAESSLEGQTIPDDCTVVYIQTHDGWRTQILDEEGDEVSITDGRGNHIAKVEKR